MTTPETGKVTVIDRFAGEHEFLSNFYHCHPVRFLYEGILYPTVEHAFAAAKTNDLDCKRRIALTGSPSRAKQLGCQAVLRTGWDQYLRYTVMEELLALKFMSGSELGDRLLDTGDAVLIEGNTWHDQTWGDCRCGHIACRPPGMNLLGWMLMRRRERLRERRGQGKETK